MDIRPTCMKCNCVLDMATIRAHPESGGFICRTCLDVAQGKNTPFSQETDTVASEKQLFAKKSYLCEECGYSFERNAQFIVKDCPMCAKTNIHQVVEEGAEEWLYE